MQNPVYFISEWNVPPKGGIFFLTQAWGGFLSLTSVILAVQQFPAMKPLTWIGLSIAAVFVLSKIATAGNASRLNFTVSNVQPGLSGLNPVITLNLVAQNPTSESFQINAVVANVFLNGQPIGNISGFVPVTVQPTSQANIPLRVQLSGLELIDQVLGILNGSAGVAAAVRITGTVNLDGSNIPIDVTYQAL